MVKSLFLSVPNRTSKVNHFFLRICCLAVLIFFTSPVKEITLLSYWVTLIITSHHCSKKPHSSHLDQKFFPRPDLFDAFFRHWKKPPKFARKFPNPAAFFPHMELGIHFLPQADHIWRRSVQFGGNLALGKECEKIGKKCPKKKEKLGKYEGKDGERWEKLGKRWEQKEIHLENDEKNIEMENYGTMTKIINTEHLV